MRSQKAERLFYIVNYLDNHETVTAAELARHCQTSIRSIYRDMRVLEEIGYYYTNEGRQGYKLISKPVESPQNLTFEEWMALILYPFVSGNITSEKHPHYLAYRSGLEKIGGKVHNNKSVQPISAQIGERILFQDQYYNSNHVEIMPLLVQAIAQNISIQVSYFSMHRNEMSYRKLDPYYLIPRGGQLYVIAFCHLRKEVRVFRLNRVRSIQLTEAHYQIPKSFSISDFLANRWSIFAEEMEPISFIVKFQKEISRYIYEYDFYTDTILEEQEDGSLLLKTKVKSKLEFLRWIRSFGTSAEVIEPATIRKELQREFEEMVKTYQK
ncbi:helix-turn-helix transcriptional regulator [Robertmurraya massiliosenegalensis]|uniref:helix-turn-helix transcriptional regulator n=1 Tax=Robertmurraya massiliosenegalensis TaxID=1287657 RepID=UPI0002E864B0|nr:transcriptional regulator [Robertmurraya massiliosenegalensis]